jgi:hypothetical protein
MKTVPLHGCTKPSSSLRWHPMSWAVRARIYPRLQQRENCCVVETVRSVRRTSWQKKTPAGLLAAEVPLVCRLERFRRAIVAHRRLAIRKEKPRPHWDIWGRGSRPAIRRSSSPPTASRSMGVPGADYRAAPAYPRQDSGIAKRELRTGSGGFPRRLLCISIRSRPQARAAARIDPGRSDNRSLRSRRRQGRYP